ncbi:hypothetical protein LTR15_004227 [Elasticomyces elasticus]|nr:hypothetical protein LTR15_004227 [Elasticomyces elasticus]
MDEKVQPDHKPASDQLEDLQKTTTLDTLHGDEAIRVIAGYSGDQEWSALEEKKLVRKIDRKLLSILCITYGLQYYDKAMLSQAVSHPNDIFINDVRAVAADECRLRYSLSAAIFYPGFICGAYPAIVLAQRYPIERVIFGIVLLWGICLMCTAGVTNHQGLYIQRFFLGALEAGVSPGWMLVVGG